MNNFTKTSIGSVVLAAIVGFAYIGLKNNRQDASPMAEDAESNAVQASSSNKQSQPSSGLAAALTSKRPFDGVASYAELQAKLARESVDPAQKADHLRVAAMFCESRSHAFRGKNRPALTASDNVYIQYGAAFCKNFNGRSDDQAALILSHPESDVAMAQLLVVDDKPGKEARLVADNILRSSKNPSAVVAAAGILSSAPEGEWKLGYDLARTPVEMNHVPEAQFLAARMVACDLSGGCGPGGFYSMTECVNFQACTPNVALTDVWRDNTAKPVYRLANEIRQELMKHRM